MQCAPVIAEAKKEPDPTKEFVEGIMTEMALKGAHYGEVCGGACRGGALK